MAGKVVNSSVLLLSKFGLGGQEGSPKTATAPSAKPLYNISKTNFLVFLPIANLKFYP